MMRMGGILFLRLNGSNLPSRRQIGYLFLGTFHLLGVMRVGL